MTRSCWRVPVRVFRRDHNGRPIVVERTGPIVAADDEDTARQKALDIFSDMPDHAGVGHPVFQHTGHHHLTIGALATVTAPIGADDLTLLRMLRSIRERSRIAKAVQRRNRAMGMSA